MKKTTSITNNEDGSVIMDIIVAVLIVGIFIYMTASFRTYIINQHNLNAKNYKLYTSINNKIQNIYLLDWDDLLEKKYEEYNIDNDKIHIEYRGPMVTKYNTQKIDVVFHIGTEKTIKYQLEKAIEFKRYVMRPYGLIFLSFFKKTKQRVTIVDIISKDRKEAKYYFKKT